MKTDVVIHWFRRDLRLADNPALYHAAQQGRVLPIYILDELSSGRFNKGGAILWWLHHSLKSLKKRLNDTLSVYEGNPLSILTELTQKHNITAIYWNHCYEPWELHRDKLIQDAFEAQSIPVHTYNASLLWEPWDVANDDGTPFKKYHEHYQKCRANAPAPRTPLPEPENLNFYAHASHRLSIDDLNLLPVIQWYRQLEPHWEPNEAAAQTRLNAFLDESFSNFEKERTFPAKQATSRLSPYLRSGELSPNQIWYRVKENGPKEQADHLHSLLGWREFFHHQLYHFPALADDNIQKKFNAFPWWGKTKQFTAWHQGKTGYPLIDACMRELWETGYMHFRAEEIACSFLAKNLMVHWKEGERWLRHCLTDADLAMNAGNWQRIAGCGTDAVPFSKFYNPVTEGQHYDPEGEYTRRFVPELAAMPNEYLFNPWEAPEAVLKKANVLLGKTYPLPIVDFKKSCDRALGAYNALPEASPATT